MHPIIVFSSCDADFRCVEYLCIWYQRGCASSEEGLYRRFSSLIAEEVARVGAASFSMISVINFLVNLIGLLLLESRGISGNYFRSCLYL